MVTNPLPESPPPSVTIDQMLSAGYKFLDWLNFYWNFYVIFTGIVLGWLFSAKEPWTTAQKSVVTLLFIGFCVVSLDALLRTYSALNETTSQLKTKWGQDELFKKAIVSRLSQKGWKLAVCLHGLADIAVLCSIWTITQKTS